MIVKKLKIVLNICIVLTGLLTNVVLAYTDNIEIAAAPGTGAHTVIVNDGGSGGSSGSSGSIVVVDPGIDDDYVINGIKTKAKDVWATVAFLVQIGAVGCIVFAGLRYMFASADQKADIKQGLSYLTIGAVLVFGATLIIQLVAKAAEQIM